MKNFFIRLSIGLATFLIGISLNFAYVSLNQIPEIEVISNETDSFGSYGLSVDKIDIQYSYTLSSKKYTTGIFVITNKSDEPIHYSGYDRNSHVENWILQNGKVERATKLTCHNGVEEQELKPNDSAIFEIPIPSNGNQFVAGFSFLKNKSGDSELVWVKVDEPNVFIQKLKKD